MYCKNCGKEIADDAAFCPSCGQAVKESVAPTPAPAPTAPAAVSDKSRLVAAILAWFLGVFGVHNFYVERKGNAVAQLILTITVIGAVVSAIWAFVDFVYILCGSYKDGNGLPIKNWTDD